MQHDNISCPYFALSQAAAASHIDLCAFGREMTQNKSHAEKAVKQIPVDRIPAQLLKDTQASTERMNLVSTKLATRQSNHPCPNEISIAELNDYIQKNARDIAGKTVNFGIHESVYKPMIEAATKMRENKTDLQLLALMDTQSITVDPIEKENVAENQLTF